ncbi:hypothetical protein BXZ70DRAFT_960709 [Cristinia sonorae]|uniref:BTB domain-containing protein n=1 Tax=Cristinia sonorae TaxID=1940300 RepID=A0A8K0UE50_9AGAR|nr:hypothetical protein BXZ70DRAFT_960709 [Cristinia sonorae]
MPKDACSSLQRHPTYYLEGGDLVLKVENTLYRLLRSHLALHSVTFKSVLGIPGGEGSDGQSDESPLELFQVKESDFNWWLDWIFHSSATQLYNFSEQQLYVILQLSDKFQSEDGIKFAIDHLALHDMPPLLRMSLGIKYRVQEWVRTAANQFMRQPVGSLSVEDFRQLGDIAHIIYRRHDELEDRRKSASLGPPSFRTSIGPASGCTPEAHTSCHNAWGSFWTRQVPKLLLHPDKAQVKVFDTVPDALEALACPSGLNPACRAAFLDGVRHFKYEVLHFETYIMQEGVAEIITHFAASA